jgi:hypothetical protein
VNFFFHFAAGGGEVDHAIRAQVFFKRNQFAAREAVEEHGGGGGWRLLAMAFEERFEIAFLHSVDATEFDAPERFIFDELQHGKVMKLKRFGDFFGSHESLEHLI